MRSAFCGGWALLALAAVAFVLASGAVAAAQTVMDGEDLLSRHLLVPSGPALFPSVYGKLTAEQQRGIQTCLPGGGGGFGKALGLTSVNDTGFQQLLGGLRAPPRIDSRRTIAAMKRFKDLEGQQCARPRFCSFSCDVS